MRIFICSTCYDLIDLRAELEMFFREAGVVAVLSDSLSSDFQVMPDRSSIETCLTNVRSCDAFLIILSNRYGPSLAKAGFNDISATHLEYEEAIKCKIPIRMFVRDRLEADYNIWQKNGKKTEVELSWCKEQRDWKIFDLLEEHRKLAKNHAHSNWFWTFRDSIEMKQRLTLEFKEAFARVAVTKLAASGRTPFLEISEVFLGNDRNFVNLELHIKNLGIVVAVSPVLELNGTKNRWNLRSIAGQELIPQRIQWAFSEAKIEILSRLTYSILDGHKFEDEGKLTITYNHLGRRHEQVSYELLKRKYVGADLGMLIT
jgi:hypothetical protein